MIIHSPENLGTYIRDRRKKLKLNQKEVGDLVGLKQKTISTIETNPNNVRLETLFKVMSAIKLELTLSPKPNSPGYKIQREYEW